MTPVKRVAWFLSGFFVNVASVGQWLGLQEQWTKEDYHFVVWSNGSPYPEINSLDGE